MMQSLFYNFGKNILNSFHGKNLVWHLVAIISTYFIVISGFDWTYSHYLQNPTLLYILFISAPLGGLIPLVAPLIVISWGKIRKNLTLLNTGYALAQSAILGSFISSLYKGFTGRAHPDPFGTLTHDITHLFDFGFFREGIFWGWPSSHTTIAFAMSYTLCALYPKNKIVQTLSIMYALYIGIGVSVTIHWFSDFTAGMIIGIIIGNVVGKSFKNRNLTQPYK